LSKKGGHWGLKYNIKRFFTAFSHGLVYNKKLEQKDHLSITYS